MTTRQSTESGSFLIRVVSFVAVVAVLGAPGVAVGAVATAPPVDTSAPTIGGVLRQGQMVTVSSGWGGDGEIDYAYQWQRCDASGASCAPIGTATAQSYVLAAADVGATLRVVVIATNAGGATSATSAPTAVVRAPPAAPTISAPPSLNGAAVVGSTLRVQSGTWDGDTPIAYAYQWQRCALSSACQNIAGATDSAYKMAAADSGKQLRAQVTATNDVSANSAASGLSDIVTGGPNAPSNTRLTTIAGITQVGQTLTASSGTWSGPPPFTFVYQWQRCIANGSGCESIPAATDRTYTLVAADSGKQLAVLVTALIAGGAGRARSSVSAIVTGGDTAPVNTTLPALAGTAEVGQTLSVTTGSWVGAPPLADAYQWQRCPQAGACESIAAATGPTYKPGPADRGATIRAIVTASNTLGSTSATSRRSAAVVAAGSLGSVVLGDGLTSVPVSSLVAPDRLTLARVQFSPTVLHSHARFTVRLRVGDLRGKVVRGALVEVRGIPAEAIAASASERSTSEDGWVSFVLRPTAKLELRAGSFALFVRIRKPGEPLLTGISNQQLAEVPLGRPNP